MGPFFGPKLFFLARSTLNLSRIIIRTIPRAAGEPPQKRYSQSKIIIFYVKDGASTNEQRSVYLSPRMRASMVEWLLTAEKKTTN